MKKSSATNDQRAEDDDLSTTPHLWKRLMSHVLISLEVPT